MRELNKKNAFSDFCLCEKLGSELYLGVVTDIIV